MQAFDVIYSLIAHGDNVSPEKKTQTIAAACDQINFSENHFEPNRYIHRNAYKKWYGDKRDCIILYIPFAIATIQFRQSMIYAM